MSFKRKDKITKFMTKAYLTSLLMSKDQSTKVSALFLDPKDFTPLTEGYNGMPRGVNEHIQERHERPLKYSFYEHAERNAIFNLARRELLGSIAVTTKLPNISCARAVISVGCLEICFPAPSPEEENSVEFKIAKELFSETNVKLRYIEHKKIKNCEDERKKRKLNEYVQKAYMITSLDMVKDPNPDATIFVSADDYRSLTEGYSGFPRGADDSLTHRYYGKEREQWVEGSIRNAIYNHVRPILKDSLCTVTATTCVECARACAGVGSKQIAYMEPTEDFKSRWKSSLDNAISTMDALGIEHLEIPRNEIINNASKITDLIKQEQGINILSSNTP